MGRYQLRSRIERLFARFKKFRRLLDVVAIISSAWFSLLACCAFEKSTKPLLGTGIPGLWAEWFSTKYRGMSNRKERSCSPSRGYRSPSLSYCYSLLSRSRKHGRRVRSVIRRKPGSPGSTRNFHFLGTATGSPWLTPPIPCKPAKIG